MYKLLLLVFISSFFCKPAISQDDWDLKKDKNDIKVFTRKSKQFKFDEIKVECTMNGRISQLAAVLMDIPDHSEWVYKTKTSRIIKVLSATDMYYYTEVECPWPFANRDVVVHMTVTQNAATKTMTVEDNNANGILPDIKDVVRIKYTKVTWLATPINDKSFKVTYQIQVEPGGSLPAWLLNLFVTKGPYESFMNLKERLTMPKYVNAKFGFLAD